MSIVYLLKRRRIYMEPVKGCVVLIVVVSLAIIRLPPRNFPLQRPGLLCEMRLLLNYRFDSMLMLWTIAALILDN